MASQGFENLTRLRDEGCCRVWGSLFRIRGELRTGRLMNPAYVFSVGWTGAGELEEELIPELSLVTIGDFIMG